MAWVVGMRGLSPERFGSDNLNEDSRLSVLPRALAGGSSVLSSPQVESK
jgi:hypothetical protein